MAPVRLLAFSSCRRSRFVWHFPQSGTSLCDQPGAWMPSRVVVAVHFSVLLVGRLSSEGHHGHLATAVPWPASEPIVPWDSKEKDILNKLKPYPHKTRLSAWGELKLGWFLTRRCLLLLRLLPSLHHGQFAPCPCRAERVAVLNTLCSVAAELCWGRWKKAISKAGRRLSRIYGGGQLKWSGFGNEAGFRSG